MPDWLAVKVPEPPNTPVPCTVKVPLPTEDEVIKPALLLNILNGIVDICVFLLAVPSTTTISSVPTNVPDALNSFKSKVNPTDAELDWLRVNDVAPSKPVPVVTVIVALLTVGKDAEVIYPELLVHWDMLPPLFVSVLLDDAVIYPAPFVNWLLFVGISLVKAITDHPWVVLIAVLLKFL